MTHYAIIDCETTGLDPVIKPVEVAWIVIDEETNVLDEHVYRVNPHRLISEGARAIHGISNEDVALCPPIESVMGLLPQPFVAIGHIVAFDLRVLGPYIKYSGQVCTCALSRKWIKNTTNHKLATLQKELKLSAQMSHTALGDCRTALELLRMVIKLCGRQLPQLIELESVPKMLNVMPFGMYKGKPFNQVPRSYRNWLLDQDNLPKDLQYTLEKLRII